MTADFEVPNQLRSRYKDFELIGVGAMGRVFKATDSMLLIDVAIKVLLETRHVRSESAVRFQQEAKAVSKLQHRNILTVMDFGITEVGEPYLVMEYVDGKPLSTILQEQKCLSLSQSLNFVGQICDGMEHAHGLGVIHRDLKPANIIVVGDDYDAASIRILDFGIAKVETLELDRNSITPEGGFLGSPQFMSPEQMSGEAVDCRSDIYSVSCMLFQMLAGVHPFERDSLLELMQAKREQVAPLVNQIGNHDNVPPHIEDAIAKSLERERSQRFATMQEFKDALLVEIHPDDSAVLERTTSKSWIAGIAAVVLLFGAISGFILMVFRPAQPVPEEIPSASPQIVLKDDELTQTSRVADLFDLKDDGKVWEAKGKIHDDALAQLISKPIIELRLPSQNQITPRGYSYIGRMPKLKVLTLTGASLDDNGLREIAHARELDTLRINETDVTDAGMAALASTKISFLNINQVKLTDASLKYIAQMKHLHRLFASDTRITNEGLKIIRHLPIRVLHIESSGINNEGMKNMPGIEVIDEKTKQKTSTLVGLHLGQCSVNVKGLEFIRTAPLNDLVVTGSSDFDDECVDYIVKTWPKIRVLLMDDTNVTRSSIKKICMLKDLEQLGIASLGLTDDDVLPILKLPKLSNLSVGANKITDITLQRLHFCPTLTRLDLTHCNEISPEMLKKVQQESQIKITCPIQAIKSQDSLKEITDLMAQ